MEPAGKKQMEPINTICILCNQSMQDSNFPTVTLREKGCKGINEASSKRGDTIATVPGQKVHIECRKSYTNCNYIEQARNASGSADNEKRKSGVLRSAEQSFDFKSHCFYCGTPVKTNRGRKKGVDFFPVTVIETKQVVLDVCKERQDEWADVVQARLLNIHDLPAADAVYHQPCSVSFRTGKNIPKMFATEEATCSIAKKVKLGRPSDKIRTDAFLKVTHYLKENDNEQITVNDLSDKMAEYLEDVSIHPYSHIHMKKQLMEHFGDDIIITEINGKPNVVTFRNTAESVLQNFHDKQKDDPGQEKLHIIEAAAKLIQNDIKSVETLNDYYPQTDKLQSEKDNLDFLPNSLREFLRYMITGKNTGVKLASIGQAIMQAARPRVLLAPLQIGLAVQMHHHFASRFLIDSLNEHGFCSPYHEVQRFNQNAAVDDGTDIPLSTDQFVQYAADNVDHDIRTIDGNNTFHGMGMIATITPEIQQRHQVPRKSVSSQDISKAGHITIYYHQLESYDKVDITYENETVIKDVCDPTSSLDILWKTSLLFGKPRPSWSGMMQYVHEGHHPGMSSIHFLPMIDMKSTDITCIYSTLRYITEHALNHNVTPVVTFDQPLWWKALIVIKSEPPDSILHQIILRLGGFHVQMSFLGAIGHLMAGSGLDQLLELIYAPKAVEQILTGKAVSRAVRAHSIIDAVLNALLISSKMNVPVPHDSAVDKKDANGLDSGAHEEKEKGETRDVDSVPEKDDVEEKVNSSDVQEKDDNSDVEMVLEKDDGIDALEKDDDSDVQMVPEKDDVSDAQEKEYGSDVQEKDDGSGAQRVLMAEEKCSGGKTESTGETCDILQNADDLYDDLMKRRKSAQEVANDSIISKIQVLLEEMKNDLSKNRNAKLWLQYMDLVDILRRFLRAERTGNWNLHLSALSDMLPYLAASGHNHYTKSIYIYLQSMADLSETNHDVYQKFVEGFHVVRRSNRLWAGLWTDLIIEQVLMRSLKTSGGLTRGRGMTEQQRAIWLLSAPACAEVNRAMQDLTDVKYSTGEQNKEMTKARQARDMKDTETILCALEDRNPFSPDSDLRNIMNGVTADPAVNVDKAKECGKKILTSMTGKSAESFVFRKSDQVITLASKSSVKIDGQLIQCDPQLLFQRLMLACKSDDDMGKYFRYELCTFPAALFDSPHMPREAQKSVLAKTMWNATTHIGPARLQTNVQYVVDGGALLHVIQWPKGCPTYREICIVYCEYVVRKYGKAVIVFDGYKDASTKDITHLRRTRGKVSKKVNFTDEMKVTMRKDQFLTNTANKHNFIMMLGQYLESYGCQVVHADADADVVIVQAALDSADSSDTVVIGDDTDLLVLLCFHVKMDAGEVFLQSSTKKKASENRIWDIKKVKAELGPDLSDNILFLHAILGCDTTSRLFGIGKGLSLKKIKSSEEFKIQAEVFSNPESKKEDIITAGEKALVCLYSGEKGQSLDALRYHKFCEKVATKATQVTPQTLPPSSAAAKFHSMRVFFQTMIWKMLSNDALCPEEWGWNLNNGMLLPVMTDLPPAPDELLKIIRCNCNGDCGTLRCTCRKHNLLCSNVCGHCKGSACINSYKSVETSDTDDAENDNEL